MWCGAVPTSKIYFFLTVTMRLEVHFVVFFGYIITRNESFNRSSPFSHKAASEMLQLLHFVAMHRIFAEILPPLGHGEDTTSPINVVSSLEGERQ